VVYAILYKKFLIFEPNSNLMLFWRLLLLVSLLLVLYNYAGYAVIAYVLMRLRGRRAGGKEEDTAGFTPGVSFIVAAYNEEDCVQQKIDNCRGLDYPEGLLECIFVTDGSSDGTPDIVRKNPGVRLLHEAARRGKAAAMNRAVAEAHHNLLIFSDANTLLNRDAIRNIVRHYRDEKTGGVAGEKKVIPPGDNSGSPAAGEGAYWKYESRLKKIDADFYSVVGAAGELFSLRKGLYESLDSSIILDDFVLSLRVTLKGYRVRYEPGAFAMELPSFSVGDERKRKVRIAAGGFQAMKLLYPLLAFWRHPALSFLYISHRVLRWTFSPLCLILAFIANGVLAFQAGAAAGERVLFAAQVLFYLLSLVGAAGHNQRRMSGLLKLPYYFVFMNLCVIQGFFRYMNGKQSGAWERARRAQAA
jgi:poly-beta-1,6-N-acetyl-D-glucosamine synthase